MNLDVIVSELWAEQRRVNAALVALVGTSVAPKEIQPVAVPQSASPLVPVTAMPHRTMSSSVRRKISTSQKARWAKRAKLKSKPKYELSPVIKKKISTSQKARWATIKAAAFQAGVAQAAMIPVPQADHGSKMAAA